MKVGITRAQQRIDMVLWRSLDKRARAELLRNGDVVLGPDNLPEIRSELLAATVRDLETALGLRGAPLIAPKVHAVSDTEAPPPAPRLVYLESPYAGNRRKNDAYLKAAMRDSLARNEAPYASHALFTQFLDDDVPAERERGIEAGLAWGEKSEATVVYVDLGVSDGMRFGIERATRAGRPVEYRTVPSWTWPPKETP